MGGPSGVPDAHGSEDGFGLEQLSEAFADLSLALAYLKRAVLEDADAGTVIAAVLELAQAGKDDGAGFLFTDVSDDAAHNLRSWELGFGFGPVYSDARCGVESRP